MNKKFGVWKSQVLRASTILEKIQNVPLLELISENSFRFSIFTCKHKLFISTNFNEINVESE